MDLETKVQALLDDDKISSYQINQETGVEEPVIVDLRSGNLKVDELTIRTANKLAHYYDSAMIDLALNGEDNERLRKFPNTLAHYFNEVIENYSTYAQSPNADPDDKPMAFVFSKMFEDVGNDNLEVARLFSEYNKHIK